MKTIINIQQNQQEMSLDFLDCLRKREIPSRFSYWGKKETSEWLDLCHNKNYNVYLDSIMFQENSVNHIIKNITEGKQKKYNYISLGPGNGEKDGVTLKSILRHGGEIKYFPVDISIDMLNQGIDYIYKDKTLEETHTTGFVSDFMTFESISRRVRESGFKKHITAILGNTIGNFGQIEIFNNLRRGLTGGDLLLVEVTLRHNYGPKVNKNLTKLIEGYNNDSFKKFVFSPLVKAGFKLSDGVIEIEYGPNRHYPKLYSLEAWFRIKKDKVINYLNNEIVFKKDERILLYMSHKYTCENIEELFDGNGFKMNSFTISENGSSGLFLGSVK